MPSSAPPPKPANPSKAIFDPFNSSATGHQRAENRLSGSTSWRDSRNLKLHEQFSSGVGGGKRVSDTVGAGSLDFGKDGRTETGGWKPGAKGLRTGGQRSIWESMDVEKDDEKPSKRIKVEGEEEKPTKVVNPFTPFKREDGKVRETSWTSHESSPSHLLEPIDPSTITSTTHSSTAEDKPAEPRPPPPQIFANLRIYINGTTTPYIGDHKLKHLLSAHGANLTIALGRRTVTHVIVGKTVANGGCSGGLSGSKIQKEVQRIGGKGLKFVTAEWAVESVKAGKRLPESRFQAVEVGGKGQASVAGMWRQQKGGAQAKDGKG